MAWRSSGTTNDEMVDNLKRFGVISSVAVEEGFRNVDRLYFVPQNRQEMAYADQPLKEGNVHISAPHIYGSVLEALELRPNSSLSVLNAGSGTAYLTCIMASILGHRSTHYCVEIHDDVVQHSKESIARWERGNSGARPSFQIDIIHGNALQIVPDKGESVLGFDRIYIGAAVDNSVLPRLKQLLKPGGVLVGPVDDELVKVVRIQSPSSSTKNFTDCKNRGDTRDFTQQVLSGVRFAPLIHQPDLHTVIPSRVWDPSMHQYYPDSFRNSCKELLLCSNSQFEQPPKPQPEQKQPVNLASMLPRVLWMEILSYAHRDWFEAPQSEVEFLRLRLIEEQQNAQRANMARLEAETRCHIAERERDVYRLLARRWQSRLNVVLNNNSGSQSHHPYARGEDDAAFSSENESVEDAGPAVLLNRREQVAIFGLRGMFRPFRAHRAQARGGDNVFDVDDQDDEEDGDDGDEIEDLLERNGISRMEEDEDDINEAMVEDDGEDLDDDESISASSDEQATAASITVTSSSSTAMLLNGIDATSRKSITVRPQLRSVSISGPDV